MKKYIKLLRIPHYLKNCLILFPFVCGKQLLNPDLWQRIIPGFFAFCLLCSAIYVINDIRDIEKDRNHPTKCRRPLASGEISVRCAVFMAVLLILGASALHLLTHAHWSALAILFSYFLLNLGYSFGLKNIPIIDICLLVSGFLLRVFYGAAITAISISNWMYLTVMMLSFFLGLGKRRNELIRTGSDSTRNVLRFYNKEFLDKFMYMCLSIAIVFYSLWCVDPATIQSSGNKLVFTIPVAIALCMKYSLDIEGNSDGDPVNVVLKDKLLLLLGAVFAILFCLFLYL
jgi:4-hydroxybenzoate polyprenyltransferase